MQSSSLNQTENKNNENKEFFSHLLVGVIIEENMLCVIISLIDQKHLSNFSMMIVGFVALIIILNGHGAELFESLKHGLILLDRVREHIDVLILVSKLVINHLVELIEIIGVSH